MNPGDPVIVDGEIGEAFLRPRPDVIEAVQARAAVREQRRAEFDRLRDTPAFTRDGVQGHPAHERRLGGGSGEPGR